MNTKTKSRGAMAGLIALAAMAMTATGAWALDPDSDAFTIRITPNLDYGIDVDTATTQFDTGDPPGDLDVTLSLGATNFFISPATVTVKGNFNNQEVYVRAVALDNWTVDADETADLNQVQLYGLFTVNKTSAPLLAEFGSDSARHLIAGSAQYAGEPQGSETNTRTANRYEIANGDMTSGTDMDGLTVGTIKQLWLRVDSPPTSDYDTAQRFQVIVTADSGTIH